MPVKDNMLCLGNAGSGSPIHVSKDTQATLAARPHWLTVKWLLKSLSRNEGAVTIGSAERTPGS